MSISHPGRIIEVTWGLPSEAAPAAYPIEVIVEADDRHGLLRDISEVFVRGRINLIGAHTRSIKDARGGTAWMTFTVEVEQASRIAPVLQEIRRVPGVRTASRR
jgi:GTP pyrophosphokinase